MNSFALFLKLLLVLSPPGVSAKQGPASGPTSAPGGAQDTSDNRVSILEIPGTASLGETWATTQACRHDGWKQ